MQLKGKLNRIIPGGIDYTLVEFEIPAYQRKWVEELDTTILYNIDIQEAQKKKTQNQNKTSWLLMNDIARQEDIFPDADAVYLQLLKMAKIGTMIIVTNDIDFIYNEEKEEGKTTLTNDELVERLKTVYRVAIIHKRWQNEKGYNVSQVEVGLGMSHFGKKQMAKFIEMLLYYAEQVGVETEKYYFT